MSVGRSLLGVLAVLLVVVSLVCLARFARRRLLPSWSGPPAWLADAVAAIGILILVAELLGVLGVFRPLPLVILLVALAAGTVLVDRARPVEPRQGLPAPGSQRTSRQEHWWERVGAVLAVALLGAEWTPGTIQSYRIGMFGTDSLWYHGPVAANFVLTGHILPLYNIGNDNTIEFYPYSSELVHAVGMTLIGTDVLSPLLNLGWLALALFAGWCIGRRFDVASIALVATALVMAMPQIAGDDAGQAYNDIVGVALVMASVALLVNAGYLGSLSSWKQPRALWFAALAAGLAVGVKYPMLVPVVALTVVVGILAPSKARLRAIVQWCLLVFVGGGLWYARNLAYAGNPIPNAHINLGFMTLPSPPTLPSPSPSAFLTNGSDWRQFFLPGFSEAFGPAWWVILALAALGMIAGFLVCPRAWARTLDPTRRDRRRNRTRAAARADRRFTPEYALAARILAVVGIATMVGYLFSPESSLPWAFVYNLRYMILGVLSGVLALTVAVSRRTRVAFVLLGIFECALIATQFSSFNPTNQSPAESVPTIFVILVLGLAILTVRSRRSGNKQKTSDRPANALKIGWRFAGAAGAVVAVGVVLLAFPLQRYYINHRYQNHLYPLFEWASKVHHVRIGVEGGLILNYPLNGSDFTNSVTAIGRHSPHGAYSSIDTCSAFVQTSGADHLQYVLVVENIGRGNNIVGGQANGWLNSQPTQVVLRQYFPDPVGIQASTLYRIRGTMTPTRCTST